MADYQFIVDNGATISKRSGSDGKIKANNIVLDKVISFQGPTGSGVTDELLALINSKIDDAYVEEGDLVLVANEQEVVRLSGIGGGGGGGGGGNNARLTVTNTSGFIAKTVAYGGDCVLSFSWSSIEDEMPTGAGTLMVKVGGVNKHTQSIEQGSVSVNVGSLLSAGQQSVVLTVSDVYGNYRNLNFTISTIAISVSSTFDDTIAYDGDIDFTYTPEGNVSKTVHFIIDGTEVGTQTTSSSGERLTYTISALEHGSHLLEVYLTATVGSEITSNHLYFSLICLEEGETDTIIASPFAQTTAVQYEAVNIPYIVYDPTGVLYCDVTLKVDNVTVQTLSNVNRYRQIWNWVPQTSGSHTLAIVANNVSKTFTLTVSESQIPISPITTNMSLHLNALNRSNSEANPAVWQDTGNSISCTLSNFTFTDADGWHSDEGGSFLRVSQSARVTIPYKIFASDFRSTGKTIEFEFRTSEILDYDAVLISCWSGSRGFKITSQMVTLASAQSSLSTQFKEDEHVRVSFVVTSTSNSRLILCYINGVISGAVQYPSDDDFEQGTPVDITIGSNYATTDIFRIRIYDVDLTRRQMVTNWIADMQNGVQKTEAYNANDNYNDYSQIQIGKLPYGLPYMIITGPLPTYKDDVKTVSGEYVDPVDPSRCFTFTGAEIDVQGTSSQNYPRKNYKIKFDGGFKMTSSGQIVPKFAMRSDSVPVKTFTFKADFASSEGANNVELVRYYCDLCPYETPPQEAATTQDIRQGIDGFPIVMFHRADSESDPTFLGKYNFNNDKGTAEVYGFGTGDESWEILRNSGTNVIFETADYDEGEWEDDFEARYPKDNTDVSNLASLAEWIVSTNRDDATDDALEESVTIDGVTYTTDSEDYRLAVFRRDLHLYMEVDSAIFYYLFTELFLMVDSRAKNAFPTKYADGKWCWLPYDMDTAIGINNEGDLVFGYNLEDTDTLNEGADKVFNGQDSVLWNNLRDAFPSEIKAMYRTLRSKQTSPLSFAEIESRFETHQGKWSASIFNEDAWFKYVLPLVEDNADYLAMCLGSKAEQRKWWLYNRFKYMDSKYNTGEASSKFVSFRSYATGDSTFKITPYADIYPAVTWGTGNLKTARGAKGVETSLVFTNVSDPNDLETKIYSADQLKSIGDIGKFHCDKVDISMATKLQSLTVGVDSGTNPNLTQLTLGNNRLLTTISAKNCTNLSTSVDARGCTGLVSADFSNTKIPSLQLPNGGVLTTLYLPETITNLTIRNQQSISTLIFDGTLTSLSTLWIENVSSAVWNKVFWTTSSVFHSLLENITGTKRVRLIGFDLEVATWSDVQDFIDFLEPCTGITETGAYVAKAQISGTLDAGTITQNQLDKLEEDYPSLTVTYDTLITTCNVQFCDEDGTVLQTVTVSSGGTATFTETSPSKASTSGADYWWDGWSLTRGGEAVVSRASSCADVTGSFKLYAHYLAFEKKSVTYTTDNVYAVTPSSGYSALGSLSVTTNVPASQ